MDWDRLTQQLPAHAAVLESALEAYRTEEGVVGIFLKGSLARGDYDQWSDIDFHLVVTEEVYPVLLASRPDRMRRLGRCLCEWSSTGEHQLLCLYDSGVTLEIDFHLPVRLTRPRAGMDGEMAILHDPTGALAAFKAECAALVIPTEVDPQRLLHLWNKVWAWLYIATGKAYRGELWEAQDFLNAIRQGAILPVYRTLKGRAPFGYRRLEGWAEPVPAGPQADRHPPGPGRPGCRSAPRRGSVCRAGTGARSAIRRVSAGPAYPDGNTSGRIAPAPS